MALLKRSLNRVGSSEEKRGGGGYKQRVLRVEGEFRQEELETTDRMGFDEIGMKKRSESLAAIVGLEDSDDGARGCRGG